MHVLFALPIAIDGTKFRESAWSVFWFVIHLAVSLTTYLMCAKGPGFIQEGDGVPLVDDPQGWECNACHMKVPMRCGHCRKCGRCLFRKDHHCPWIGTCIGKDNHLFFLVFIVALFNVSRNVISGCWRVASTRHPLKTWLMTSLPCAIDVGLAGFCLLQVSFLIPTHIFLACMNYTTWEFMKSGSISYLRDWDSFYSPFSKGLMGNIKEFLTMRWNTPSYHIPDSRQAMEQWKEDNSFFFNDKYELC